MPFLAILGTDVTLHFYVFTIFVLDYLYLDLYVTTIPILYLVYLFHIGFLLICYECFVVSDVLISKIEPSLFLNFH